MREIADADIDRELAGIAAATDDDRFPRVVLTADVGGVPVSIVEPCMPRPDGVERGYVYLALTGPFRLRAGWIENGGSVPGTATGGTIISTSTAGAERCLRNARRVLADRARGV